MQVAAEEQLGRAYDSRLLRWVWQYVQPYRSLFWISVIFMPLNSVFSLAEPYVIKITIDLFLARSATPMAPWIRPLLTPILRAFAGHGLLAMGLLYLALI